MKFFWDTGRKATAATDNDKSARKAVKIFFINQSRESITNPTHGNQMSP